MEQLKYSPVSTASSVSKVLPRLQFPNVGKMPKLTEAASVLLPLCALLLWVISLKDVNIRDMTDLGLVSVFPASIIIALVILTISFCLTLRHPKLPVLIILLHLFLLIFMLYGITTLVEEAPRFTIVYLHAGYTEYIMRTGSVNPGLDAYFSWPGFFVLSAFVTRVTGYHDILPLAAWAPAFFNLIYLGPLYMIFTSATTDKRLIWLGLWFFYLTNWIGQDYFSPQGFNFFLYLVIIAILLKWFKVTTQAHPRIPGQLERDLGRFSPLAQSLHTWLTLPDTLCTPSQPRQRTTLLISLVIIFALVVFSHPLTPFFVLVSVTALVIFRRCTPRWLPILMATMTGAWIIIMAQPFLAGHLYEVFGNFGQVSNAITANLTARVEGSQGHIFISEMRVIMTAAIWGIAFIGAVRRLCKGYHDISYILLVIAPFSLIVANSYDGEMLLRIYLFSLPLVVFFAAALFYTTPISGMSRKMTAAVVGISLILLGGFLFTRYGNERMDYMTNAEVEGIHYLYSVAQPDSLLIESTYSTPWQFQDLEKYNYYTLTEVLPNAVTNRDVDSIVRFINRENPPDAYLIFARSEKASAELFLGLPPNALDRLEDALLGSGKFTLMYSNPDVQIINYIKH
jgi:hypothetical protein